MRVRPLFSKLSLGLAFAMVFFASTSFAATTHSKAHAKKTTHRSVKAKKTKPPLQDVDVGIPNRHHKIDENNYYHISQRDLKDRIVKAPPLFHKGL